LIEDILACPELPLLFWKMNILHMLFTFLIILGLARLFSTLNDEEEFGLAELFYIGLLSSKLLELQ
jgi:hypothetical protein